MDSPQIECVDRPFSTEYWLQPDQSDSKPILRLIIFMSSISKHDNKKLINKNEKGSF